MNEKNIRLVTAESVRAGHPDKFCDQIADAILDAHLRQDPNARVAVEVFATAGKMLIGGEVSLPLHVYQNQGEGSVKALEHPLYPILHDEPNSEMTSFVWRETMLAHLLLWGKTNYQLYT